MHATDTILELRVWYVILEVTWYGVSQYQGLRLKLTLSRGNLPCPSEAKVILWEPTRQKLLERRVLRAGRAAADEETHNQTSWPAWTNCCQASLLPGRAASTSDSQFIFGAEYFKTFTWSYYSTVTQVCEMLSEIKTHMSDCYWISAGTKETVWDDTCVRGFTEITHLKYKHSLWWCSGASLVWPEYVNMCQWVRSLSLISRHLAHCLWERHTLTRDLVVVRSMLELLAEVWD